MVTGEGKLSPAFDYFDRQLRPSYKHRETCRWLSAVCAVAAAGGLPHPTSLTFVSSRAVNAFRSGVVAEGHSAAYPLFFRADQLKVS